MVEQETGDKPERVTMQEYIRLLAARFEAMAAWFDQGLDKKLPIRAAYIDELAEWVEEDSKAMAKSMRAFAKALRQPELPLEPGVYRADEDEGEETSDG